MQIFTDLAKVGPQYGGQEEKDDLAEYMPFYAAEPHPGLRTYPFLSQACLPFMQTQTFALTGACTNGTVQEISVVLVALALRILRLCTWLSLLVVHGDRKNSCYQESVHVCRVRFPLHC